MNEAMTIVVPVKDRATLVLRTLDSIKAQTWRPLKLIVVDNGSTDGTPDTVADWIRCNATEDFQATLLFEPTAGASNARNCGLEAVDTRLMMFFDSDDIMQPGHVESIMRRFHAGDDPDLVCFRVKYHPINGEDRVTKKPGRDMMVTHICHALYRTQGFACETALARRAGGWDTDVKCWVDLEYGTRVHAEARKRAYIPEVNVDVYAQVESITGTRFSNKRGEWEKAMDKMDAYFDSSRHRNAVKWKKIIQYKRVILAAHYKREGNQEASKALLEKVARDRSLNALQRLYLKLSYHYTAMGGRGSASVINLIF